MQIHRMNTLFNAIVVNPFEQHCWFKRKIIVTIDKILLYQIVVHSAFGSNLLLYIFIFGLTDEKCGSNMKIDFGLIVVFLQKK